MCGCFNVFYASGCVCSFQMCAVIASHDRTTIIYRSAMSYYRGVISSNTSCCLMNMICAVIDRMCGVIASHDRTTIIYRSAMSYYRSVISSDTS